MHIHAALAAELAQLTAALDDPTIDLADCLDQLAAAATAAVASFRGLSITATTGQGQPVTFTHLPMPGTILASLRAPLPPSPGALTLYGGAPGAFVDLAADITWLSGTNLADITLDQHLRPPALAPSGGLRDIVSINQAIGILLNRGYLPEQARSQLDAWADAHGTNRQQAAEHLLAHLDDPGPDHGPGATASRSS